MSAEEYESIRTNVSRGHAEIISNYEPRENSAHGLTALNGEYKNLLLNENFKHSVRGLSKELKDAGFTSNFTLNEPQDNTLVDYIINITTDNIQAHITFHLKGNPKSNFDNTGAFHLKIDKILGLKNKHRELNFRFTPIFLDRTATEGRVVFRLTRIIPRSDYSFSMGKPLNVDSLRFDRIVLRYEVLIDIYRIIYIIQNFIFSYNAEGRATPLEAAAAAARAAGGGYGGGYDGGGYDGGGYGSGGGGGGGVGGGGGGGGFKTRLRAGASEFWPGGAGGAGVASETRLRAGASEFWPGGAGGAGVASETRLRAGASEFWPGGAGGAGVASETQLRAEASEFWPGGAGGGGYGSAFGTPKGRVGGYRRTRIRKHKKSSTKKLRRGQTRRKSN
jgi:hypothetical protein